jgi:hypothetical protein
VERIRAANRVGKLGRKSDSAGIAGHGFDHSRAAHVHQTALVVREGEGTHGGEVVGQRFPAIREKAAERRTGYTKADANTRAACTASLEAMETLRDTVPQTFTGLAAKAKAARHLKDDWAEELGASLGRDIGVMAGEVDRGAVR